MTAKDYYEILGISRTADQKEIKAAYRRLARKHHPDVNKGDKAAEEKFKQVAEAFAVLSDTEKRARYDGGGHEAFGAGFNPFAGVDAQHFDFGFGDLSDLLRGAGFNFGGQRSHSTGRQAVRRGEDLRLEVRVPFLSAVRGDTVELAIPRHGGCEECNGSGLRPGASETGCPDCAGSGRRAQRRGGLHVSLRCSRCGGAGRLRGEPCRRCNGSARVPLEDRVKVRIPAGIEDGGMVRLAGKGNSGLAGGPPGDAYVTIRVEPDAVFQRQGNQLICDVPVGLATAALGGKIEVPTLNGGATISIPAGTRSGQKFRLKGRGVPAAQGRAAGDLFAVVQIHPPRKLDKRSRELLEEFQRLNPSA